ncbi:S-adenosyl-L-methionine-dependent methyltransferases superfamily protein [Euphorbia peplus]|nr:S-adenosyl-L-methionine-dependent methyltransferases superfamily protein [Euphorbia peplus]
MKPSTAADIFRTPQIAPLLLLSLSLLLIFYHLPSIPSLFSDLSTPNSTSSSPPALPKPRRRIPPPGIKVSPRMGILDDSGAMSSDFEIGEFDSTLVDEFRSLSGGMEEHKENDSVGIVKYDKFKVCEDVKTDYIPCFDQTLQRHCPELGKGLNCLLPMPQGYRKSIPWPKSRDEVWFSNVPHTHLVEDKGRQNLIAKQGDKVIFPGGGKQFTHGVDHYLNQISQMVPDIAFGQRTRVALDIGSGVADFGAFLLQRNVTTLTIAPKYVHENQIQFALERGVPAMVAVFSSRRLLYPSQAFDLIHCSTWMMNWTSDAGNEDENFLLEANRILRAGGYFIWTAEPVYKHRENVEEKWREIENLTSKICWELVKKEGYTAIWRKPLNNSCYLNRDTGSQPPLCNSSDDPDNVWYANLTACITKLPENGYGGNISAWPERLHHPPDRLQSIKMEFSISRKELFKAESRYWNDIIESYVRAFHWRELNFRNVIDMRAGFGGFASALHDLQVDSWVMNVVPINGFNTLPVIYDRGLIGVLHDWCEPFDTYPRTFDLLHAAGLFSVEQKRKKCKISSIMLEMDRMLRPGGKVYIRDTVSVLVELQEIATAMGWVPALHDSGEGPHASLKFLICEKRMS